MKLLILSLFVAIVAQQSVAQQEKLHIQVLYEALCPDSIRFIGNQLSPSYKDIAKYVQISFVPFGKSYSTNKEFECQHGPAECQGNRIQSCVLAALTEQDQTQDGQVEYVNCFMGSYWRNPGEYGQKCAEQAGVHWEVVKQCFESKMGTDLQLEAEKVTSQYNPSFIPTIVYDKKFDQDAQDDSMVGFRSFVCARLQKTYPEACPALELKPISAK